MRLHPPNLLKFSGWGPVATRGPESQTSDPDLILILIVILSLVVALEYYGIYKEARRHQDPPRPGASALF